MDLSWHLNGYHFWADSFSRSNDSTYYFFTNNNISDVSGMNNLLVTNKNLDVSTRSFPVSSLETPMYSMSGFISESEGKTLFMTPFSDTIFSLSNSNICPKYVFDFGKFRMPSEIYQDYSIFVSKSFDYSYITERAFEDKEFVFFNMVHNRRRTFSFYHKPSQKTYNQLDFVETALSYSFNIPKEKNDNGKYFSVLSPAQIVGLITNNPTRLVNLQQENKELFELFSSLKGSENPIVISFNLKLPEA